jgi:polyisoprenoid-binding protein YceI
MLLRRALFVGGAAALLLVAAIVAGWWFFVRDDAELATNAPDIPEELVSPTSDAQPTGGGTGDNVLTFRIIPEESEAAYFVGEELASVGLPSTAKGATSAIEGEFHLTADGLALAPGTTSQFTVDLTTLESDEDRRDSRVQDALQTSQFPTATFTIASVTGYDPAIPEGEEQTLQLAGTFDLHGVQRDVTWEVKARRQSNVITALATLEFTFAEYNNTPPNLAGFVSVEDNGALQVQLVAQLV